MFCTFVRYSRLTLSFAEVDNRATRVGPLQFENHPSHTVARRTFSHDDSYWEIDANNHAGKKFRDPESEGVVLDFIQNVIEAYIAVMF